LLAMGVLHFQLESGEEFYYMKKKKYLNKPENNQK
jgi:hypothetical protein